MKLPLRVLPAKASAGSLYVKCRSRIPQAKGAGIVPASMMVRSFKRSNSSSSSIICCSTRAPSLPVIETECQLMFQESSSSPRLQALEEGIEKAIYGCRFMTFLGVFGSLLGSLLCFLKGCVYVVDAFTEYYMSSGKAILMLVEAIDIYLIGTVMLVFGMGLYELFISNLDIAQTRKLSHPEETASYRSNLFGLFTLMERPKWLEIQSINELKTKLGHVIVMVLLIGLSEKSKKVVMCSSADLLCFAAAVLLSSGGLYLLSKLNNVKRNKQV